MGNERVEVAFAGHYVCGAAQVLIGTYVSFSCQKARNCWVDKMFLLGMCVTDALIIQVLFTKSSLSLYLCFKSDV